MATEADVTNVSFPNRYALDDTVSEKTKINKMNKKISRFLKNNIFFGDFVIFLWASQNR